MLIKGEASPALIVEQTQRLSKLAASAIKGLKESNAGNEETAGTDPNQPH